MSIQRILVVDDDQLSREFLVEAVTALGYKPVEAKNGAEALERAAASAPDLVLADLRMPGMDGVELIKRIRETVPGVPSVMITAQGTVETAVQAMRAGASDVLLKPCTAEALEVVIERVERTARLIRENEYLRQEMSASASGMVAKSAAMLETLRTAARYARSKGTVLITGESGTGKERLARYIHESSPRKDGPFIRVNCASMPEQLLLLELFGHDRASGSQRGREGRVELADGGTLLLDEIGEIPASVQARLLRLVEDEEFERLGGSTTQRVDVRILATTSRDLASEMRAGRFREELYYRLNVLPVRVAPLRDRREDVMPLAQHFATAFAKSTGLETPTFTPEAAEALQAWSWPGNVRELENTLQRAVVALRHTRIDVADLALVASGGTPASTASASSPTEALGPQLANRKLEEIERVSILATLQATRGNKTEAARRLGVTARTLSNKMKLWRSTGLVA
ncbi:MAG: sigma-54-dependent Fis family transcriptional regulator [Planctomycetes bacterium]|nr:sigma-54-dependent Fis family transcriptional regulator [Planctomycetota bacterium]